MRVDIMVDIETLGKKQDSTIFQISAIAFDINTGEYISTFDNVADISKNENPLVVDGDTLQWWLNTDANLLKKLLTENDGVSSEGVLRNFHAWIKNFENQDTTYRDIYLWGNGILFDNKMIQHQMVALGLDYPIFFKNDRDVRTIVELAGAKAKMPEKQFKALFDNPHLVKHDALDDCKYQVFMVASCYQRLVQDFAF